ncbi:MAG: Kdo hydroxylase family protein, partial [Acetobacteraceae bacterium]
LLRDLLPGYASSMERARTSFRPVEIAGRAYSPRHDDRLLHVDAFPTRPMRGRRILRLFSNIAPDGAVRAWRVGEPFPAFAARFLPRTRRPLPGSAWAMQYLGLTKGRRSAYDQLMLSLHDMGKQDAAYQASAPRAPVAFSAGSTWICFTDQVLHAALAGHCALEQTFHIPVAAMTEPDTSPLRVLERLAGRALV